MGLGQGDSLEPGRRMSGPDLIKGLPLISQHQKTYEHTLGSGDYLFPPFHPWKAPRPKEPKQCCDQGGCSLTSMLSLGPKVTMIRSQLDYPPMGLGISDHLRTLYP